MTDGNNNISRIDSSLSDKWKFRFDFFDKHGVRVSGLRHPSFKQRSSSCTGRTASRSA